MRHILLLGISLWSGILTAHALAPSMLELQATDSTAEQGQFIYSALLRQDVASQPLQLHWPAGCTSGENTIQRRERQIDQTFRLACQQSLAGQELRVEGLEIKGSALLLRHSLSGGKNQELVRVANPTVTLGQPTSGVFARYLELGGEHIIFGWDHLMLVLGVFWLAGSLKHTLGLATAFTIGHSFTLAAAVLGVLNLPGPLVEFAIAATLLWLALRLDTAKPRQKPLLEYSLISVFGLIHGMGFASSLLQIGLPSEELLLALLAFNLGVELGQLALLVAFFMVVWALRQVRPRASWTLQTASTYLIGSLACFWLIDRAPQLLN